MNELLQRYIEGNVTPEERREIMVWLEERPENEQEYRTLRKLYDFSLWNVAVAVSSRKKRFAVVRQAVIELMKVAALLLLGFIGARLFFFQTEDALRMQTIHVPSGQRVELVLADGTQVWLNSQSTLRFPDRFMAGSRQVELDGEGYFSVRHEAERPFVVRTERYAIRVLGTEFNVKAYRNSRIFETSLLRGEIEITTPGEEQVLQLMPWETAFIRNDSLLTGRIADANYFKWREGLFCFENETIESLIEKMQFYYDVSIEVQCTSLLGYRYSGKFRIKDGIEHVLKVLQHKHHFTYTRDEEMNRIVIR